jgi:hypothetical protein
MDVADFAEYIRVPFRAVVASKSESGKTVLISELVRELVKQKKIFLPYVFSNTIGLGSDWDFIPNHLKSKFSTEKLQQILDKQAATPKDDRKQLLIIFDDVLTDKDAERNDLILKCYVMGRHYFISPILVSQISNYLLTPQIKSNSCYILYSRLNRQQLASLWESVTNLDKKDFIKFSETANQNFNFIVVDNTVHSTDPLDFLHIVRASNKSSKKNK